MRLNVEKAIEIIKNPVNSSNINLVKEYESGLRIFTEEMSEVELQKEVYWKKLTERIKGKTVRKYDKLQKYMRFPLPIVQTTDSILTDYFKVFDGKNRHFNVTANREISSLNNWLDEINLEKWIEDEARVVLKNKPSSIVVVDRDESGKPFLINISSDRLIDVKLKKNGLCEYITFIHSIRDIEDESVIYYSVYDDEYYRVFSKDTRGNYELVSEYAHNLGYCPAKTFIETTSNELNPLKRRVAFGTSLSKLEDWTVFDIYRNYTDHYVPFPVTELPDVSCKDPKCKNGKVKKIINQGNEKKEFVFDCPKCKHKKDFEPGPGTIIRIKLNSNKSIEDGSGKFKLHFPKTSEIEYIPNKLDKLELEIRYKTVGISDVLSKEAVNELQVKGSFASMESVLIRTKKDLDSIYKWIVSTVANLYYVNISLSIDANFGTEFYLQSEEQLQNLFIKAKEIGLPKEEIKSIYEQLINTKYKGNNKKILRHKMLMDLDPYCFFSEKECVDLNKDGVLDSFQLSLKVNFIHFINRFERENTSITDFGTKLEYKDVINIITAELEKYNTELITIKGSRVE